MLLVCLRGKQFIYLFYFARSSVPNLNFLTLCEVGEVVESYLIQSVRAFFTSIIDQTNDQIGPKDTNVNEDDISLRVSNLKKK